MQKEFSRKLFPYWIFVTTRRSIFGLPCLFLYIETLGINPGQIGFCLSALAVSQVIFEVPSGIASDRLGRKLTLLIGAFLRTCAWIVFALAATFSWFLLGFALLGAAFAFDSGTDSAILFDALKESNLEEKYPLYESRAYTLSLLSLGFSNLVGGFFVGYGYQFPITLTIIPMISCLISTLFLYEPKFSKPSSDTVFFQQVKEGLKNIIQNDRLFKVTAISVIALAGTEIYFRFIQQFMDRNLSVNAQNFGYIYCLWLIVSATSSQLMRFSLPRKYSLQFIISVSLLFGLTLVLLSQSLSQYSILLTLIPQIVYGGIPVLFRSEINKELPSAIRATVLSVFGFLTSVFIAIGAPIFGEIEVKYATSSGFWGLGLAIVTLTVGLSMVRVRAKA